MLRTLRAFLVLSVVSIPAAAAAQEEGSEAGDTPTSDKSTYEAADSAEAGPAAGGDPRRSGGIHIARRVDLPAPCAADPLRPRAAVALNGANAVAACFRRSPD